jgi:hypothetical protein
MRIRALDTDKDWLFGSGRAAYAANNNAICLNIETIMRTFLGECFFNPDMGVPWFDIINYRNKDAVVLYLKSVMIQIYGVIKVTELEYTFTTGREFNIKYQIETLYSSNVRGEINI